MTSSPDLGALFGATGKADTFLGLDACPSLDALSAPVALIGAPCASPYPSVGAYCRNGPDALRRATASFTANIERHDFESGGPLFPERRLRPVDCGNLSFDEADAPANRDTIRAAVRTIRDKGAVPVVLGGDDSIPIPMLEALANDTGARYTVVQVDAHIDWRDTHMGERHGLSSTMRRASEMPHVERIIQVGARGIGSGATGDYQDALDWGVTFVTAREVHRGGIQPVLDLVPPGSNLVLCCDVDGMDPTEVPGVIARCPGGLTYFQMVDLIQGLAGRGRFAAMDFVEFMPERDIDGMGALTVARVIMTALGTLARQAA